MQGPERIDRICERLRQLWHKFPNQRFHQLIDNFMYDDLDHKIYTRDGSPNWLFDYYYKEDAETEYRLMTYTESIEEKISRLEMFIKMFEDSLHTLDKKVDAGTFDDGDKWHRAAINVQLSDWKTKLRSLQMKLGNAE